MTTLKNDRFLKALLGEPVDMTPVWMMRQAGRYLPEYRATRAKAGNFLKLCKTPELATEVTIQPLERFDLDAAILFSDILTIPDAMGLGLYFSEGEGPRFERPIQNEADIKNLIVPTMDKDLGYVMDAVSMIHRELDGRVPLIGFSGSPWTLATYMIEGGSSKDFSKVKSMLYENPKAMHMIFDTWGGALTTRDYKEFSLRYMEKIISGLTRENAGRKVPVTIFSKGGCQWLEAQAESGADCVGLDWTIDIGLARKRVGDKVTLQGNMDPTVLYASPERIREEVAFILDSFGKGNGHVFNLGHGIHQHVNPDNAKVLINAVHELSAPYHS